MGPDEQDTRINSSTASVTEPEFAGDFDMTITQAQPDAAPQSAVVDEKFECEVVHHTPADGNQATMVSMQDEEVVTNYPEGKDEGLGVEGGHVISGEENQLAVKESEASEGKGRAGDDEDAGYGGVVSASEETKVEGVVEADEVVREVAVTAVTDGALDIQVLECHVTAVQDGDNLSQNYVAEETLDSKEQGADDMSKKADVAEPMDIHEQTVKISMEATGAAAEGAKKEVDDYKAGEESDIAVAAEVGDNAAHGATKEVRMGNSGDGNEAVLVEVDGVATTESDNKVEMAESASVIEEGAEKEVDDTESGEENDIAAAAEVGENAAHVAMEEFRMGRSEDDNEVVEAEVAGLAAVGDDNEVEMVEAAGVIKEGAEKEVGDTEAGEENDIAVAAEVGENAADSAAEEVRRGNSEDDSNIMVADVDTPRDDNEEEMAESAEDLRVINAETDAREEIDGMEKVDEHSRSSGSQKRKRGGTKGALKVASKITMEEDVCFICFDGGDLVLCDRRKCPKAYHPSCVDRDEAFFRTKGQWFCGWHLCSKCGKNAYYMCYTCTFSLCKNCIKDSVIFCVRGKKGFCEPCMRIVKLIEDSLKGDKDMVQVDFDDRSSWEYLFKDYYVELKENLSLTLEEISRAKNPWRRSGGKQESLDDDDDDRKSNSENSSEKSAPKRRQTRRQTKSRTQERNLRIKRPDNDAKWASKELMEFVMHMNNGEKTALSQFNVHALLLKYITENKLRDPRRKGQVICDERLEILFGKHRVGHFEMLKLLESHFIAKEDPDGQQDNVFVTDEDAGVSEKASKDKKRKIRKKREDSGRQANLEEYAAIDAHNINLIYLRRNLLENLIEDTETFHDKVVGSFVRIRIPGSNQNQELYRLVPVVGTSKTGEPYKVGKRTTDFLLEILNLNKTEVLSIAIVSNQEFTEEECKRLRQSIKFGLINRLTVGDIREKAMALQAARVKDWLESETVRLSHLRDRASDLGRRKELRECIEKLQLLKTPEERQRRLEEIPEVHSDPKMDPSNDSEDDEAEEDDKKQETYVASRGNGRETNSPQKGGSYNSWSSSRSQSRELTRNLSVHAERSWSHTKDRESGQKRTNPNNARNSSGSGTMSEPAVRAVTETNAALASVETPQPATDFSDSDKIWHYQDPSGKIQGPFSMNQLRKWNSTGYFPTDLRIWKTTEKQEESVLLTDALNGNFQKDPNGNRAAASGSSLDLGRVTEVKLTAQNLQSLVQAVRNQTGLMTGPVPVPAQQPQIQGQWSRGGAAASTMPNFASSGLGHQTATQSPVPPGTNWGYTAVSRGTIPETQTANWGTANSVFSASAPVQANVTPVPSWIQPQSGNQGTWRGDQRSNQSIDVYQGDRSRVSGGWDRQGGGTGRGYSRTPPGVCRFFFENGHCKKGSSCNYRHS